MFLKAIPPACRGLIGCFAFSLQDDELVCHHYYSPFGKQRKELVILPETPSTGLAAALSYNGYPNQVAYFGLDRDWVLDTVRAYGPIALHCDGHEASVLWKEDSTSRWVNCAIGRSSQAEHDKHAARCKSQEVDDMSKCRLCGKDLSELQGSYLVRVNEKGVPGIWECRPCCGADLTQEEALLAALEPDAPAVKPEEVAADSQAQP